MRTRNLLIAILIPIALILSGCGDNTPPVQAPAAGPPPVPAKAVKDSSAPPSPQASAARSVLSKLTAGLADSGFDAWFKQAINQPLRPSAIPNVPTPDAAPKEVIQDWDALFEVTLPPGFPKPQRELQTGVLQNNGQYYRYSSEVDKGDSCLVAFAMYDEEHFNAENLTQQLDTIRDNALKGSHGQLISEERTDEFKLPGRILRVSVPLDGNRNAYSLFLYVVKSRYIYQLIYSTENQSTLDSPEVQNFIHSLKWLPAFK